VPQQVLPNVSAWHCPCYSQAAATLLQERHTCNISAVQHFLADILHDFSHLMSQVGGFKAQRSWVTALSWAAMPTLSSSSSSSPPSSSHPEQHHHAQLQQQDQLLLITGSSDGCLSSLWVKQQCRVLVLWWKGSRCSCARHCMRRTCWA